jgi:type I restriction enzyme S subunit
MSIPTSWRQTRVDRVANVNARIGWKALTASEYQPDGYVFLATPNIKSEAIDFNNVNYISEYRYEESPELKLQPGDVLLAKDGSTLGITNIVGELPRPATVNGSIAVLRAFDVEPRFLRYVLASSYTQDAIESIKGGMGVPHLFQWDIKRLPLVLPPADEQRRIADFLDAETSRIDALIEKRICQASALEELELAHIGEHLSGADIAGRRETPWPWLPTIPESWCIGPVYAYFDVQLGKMLNAERATGDDQQPYLRNANVHWYEIETDDMASMTFDASERARYGVQVGDLLVCEGGAGVAEAAVWDGRIANCFYQKSLHRVRARREIPVEWLMHWLRFAKSAGVFEADGNIATIPHLTGEQLAEYRIPIPPDGSHRVEELGSGISDIRETIRAMHAGNDLLAERGQALITAAVTGQIDVTTARGGVT